MMRQFLSRFFLSFSHFCTYPVEFGLLALLCLDKVTVCCYGFPKGRDFYFYFHIVLVISATDFTFHCFVGCGLHCV